MVRNINIGWEFQKLPQEDISKMNKIDEVSWQENLFTTVDLPHTWYEDGILIRERLCTARRSGWIVRRYSGFS